MATKPNTHGYSGSRWWSAVLGEHAVFVSGNDAEARRQVKQRATRELLRRSLDCVG